jgi:hypothetical protein
MKILGAFSPRPELTQMRNKTVQSRIFIGLVLPFTQLGRALGFTRFPAGTFFFWS